MRNDRNLFPVYNRKIPAPNSDILCVCVDVLVPIMISSPTASAKCDFALSLSSHDQGDGIARHEKIYIQINSHSRE